MEFWFDYKTFFMSNISIYHICWPYNQICRAVVKKRQIPLHISSWCLSTIRCGQLPLILVPWNKVKRVEVKNTRINNRSTFLAISVLPIGSLSAKIYIHGHTKHRADKGSADIQSGNRHFLNKIQVWASPAASIGIEFYNLDL